MHDFVPEQKKKIEGTKTSTNAIQNNKKKKVVENEHEMKMDSKHLNKMVYRAEKKGRRKTILY